MLIKGDPCRGGLDVTNRRNSPPIARAFVEYRRRRYRRLLPPARWNNKTYETCGGTWVDLEIRLKPATVVGITSHRRHARENQTGPPRPRVPSVYIYTHVRKRFNVNEKGVQIGGFRKNFSYLLNNPHKYYLQFFANTSVNTYNFYIKIYIRCKK